MKLNFIKTWWTTSTIIKLYKPNEKVNIDTKLFYDKFFYNPSTSNTEPLDATTQSLYYKLLMLLK